jgi:hypothetical protein
MKSSRPAMMVIGLSSVLAAYLSLSQLFGLLFWGFSNFLEFRLFALPVLALPVQLVAWWRLGWATGLFCTLTLVYGLTQVQVAGPSAKSIAQNHSEISLYILNSGLLVIAVFADRRRPVVS